MPRLVLKSANVIATVVNYKPSWIREFEKESTELKNRIGENNNHIHHIGSKALPGLMAKPIIDIFLDLGSMEQLDLQNNCLEDLGYEVMGELGIKGRRYFRKGGDNRTDEIHAFKSGDTNLVRHLAFRAYLINHRQIGKKYGELKFSISQRCKGDIEKYSDEEDSFVKHFETISLHWYLKKDLR